MKKLYVLSIHGAMLYFIGNVDEGLYAEINRIAKSISIAADDIDYNKFTDDFINTVLKNLKITLTRKEISYVFRR